MPAERFAPHSLAELLIDLFRSEASGCLTLNAGDGRHIRVYFHRGLVDVALRGAAESLLAQLDAQGLLDGTAGKGAEPVSDVAALASRLGPQASADAVRETIRQESQEALQDAFRFPKGTWTLAANDGPSYFEPDIPCTLEDVLLGISAIERWAPIRRILSSQDRILRPCAVPLFPVERLPLRPQEGYLLSCMDGTATFDDLANLMPGADPTDVTRFVYSALVLGFVEFEPSLITPFKLAAYADHGREEREREEQELNRIDGFYQSLRADSPYKILGVTDGATWEEIRQAYDDRKAAWRPDRFLKTVLQQRREELRIIESGLVEVFLKIQALRLDAVNEQKRAREEDKDVNLAEMQGMRMDLQKTGRKTQEESDARMAERYLEQAREGFRDGDYHTAVQFCELSIKHNGANAESLALLGEALAKNPSHRWQLRAEEALKKALSLDRWNARLYLKMAQFYDNQGMEQRAARYREKAFEIAPSLRHKPTPDPERRRP